MIHAESEFWEPRRRQEPVDSGPMVISYRVRSMARSGRGVRSYARFMRRPWSLSRDPGLVWSWSRGGA